jgi:hypothetical protein
MFREQVFEWKLIERLAAEPEDEAAAQEGDPA